MTRPTSLLPAVFAAGCIALTHAGAAAASLEDLRKLPAQGPLTDAAKRVIEEYTADGAQRVRQAKTMEQLEAARGHLEKGYAVQGSDYYQWEYAAQFAAQAAPLLSLKADPLSRVKEIQVGMMAEDMKQVSIQPLLVAMAGHSNPGVRYWAAKAYWTTLRGDPRRTSTGKRLLQLGGRHAQTMLATLQDMGLKEPSGPVLSEVLRALSPYPEVEGSLARQLRDALDKVWLARCKELQAGDSSMADAYLKALPMVGPGVQLADEKLAVQLFADAMAAAARAWAEEKNQKDEALVEALKDLILDLEGRLVEILKPGQSPIRRIISDEKMSAKVQPLEALVSMVDFWQPRLNDRGVKMRVKLTTTPATQGATQPATLPAKP
ncbi:MAG: hypothetical protein AMJ81_04485 [Phycisphaerae bacterium SM23_33]|nr:MAG: hypothetical protein AMJ81_04485 [Phycisphaerae bacterium SM23_33]